MANTNERVSDAPSMPPPALRQAQISPSAAATVAQTSVAAGLVINATFDSSITNNANAAAIQAMINQAIAIYQATFSDPVTVSILFRYSTTMPDGSPIPSGSIARSNYVIYNIAWNSFSNALNADAKTTNDTTANASLPASALSTSVVVTSANGRAISLNTPPGMFANSTVGSGGPFDGIVTLNAAAPFQFTRPPGSNNYDAQRLTEHEIDEVLGLGSYLPGGGNLRPQDLFSWSTPGTRNVSASGTRYFSIDSGNTNIVAFNQTAGGDFGDWLSGSCPQTTPYVQNAFNCVGQASDITATSPEGINLDVVGYDLVNAGAPLSISGVAPPAGRTSGGQQVTLTGTFTNLSAVMFGGVAATINSSSASQVVVTTPAHAVGAVQIDLMSTSGASYSKANAFAYLPTVFTDNTLIAGVTTAKAQHITELRQAVDALRAVAGLQPAQWTDAALAPGATSIKAIHIEELRARLEEAATSPPFNSAPAGYSDPSLSAGTPIKRIHIEELRQRIRNIAGP